MPPACERECGWPLTHYALCLGQEVKCPFCDKVYTQSGRLKEHISSKHADQKQEEPSSVASSSTPRPPAAAPSTKAPPSHPAAASLVAAASASAASCALAASQSKRPGPNSAPTPSLSTSSVSVTTGAQTVGVISIMDVGSKAGYYTHKSPKLQLLEWAQSKKMLKPRYSVRQQEGGSFTCKVDACLCYPLVVKLLSRSNAASLVCGAHTFTFALNHHTTVHDTSSICCV